MAAPQILSTGNLLDILTDNQIVQTDTVEKFMDLLTQITPQVVGEADITGMATALTATLGSVNGLVHRIDNLCNMNIRPRASL